MKINKTKNVNKKCVLKQGKNYEDFRKLNRSQPDVRQEIPCGK